MPEFFMPVPTALIPATADVGLKRMDLGLHATAPTVKNTIYSLLKQLDSFIYKKNAAHHFSTK
jgi:hypothetical protein